MIRGINIPTMFLGLALSACFPWGLVAERSKPNIILLLADDLGYGDLSCFGSPAVKTPYLDRLAREGLKCTRFYAASAVCSPTRASVLTGRYPLRFGITKHFNEALMKPMNTIFEIVLHTM